MSEIMELRGRLSTAEKKQRELRLEAKALIKSVRDALNPYEPDPTRLSVSEARVSAERLERVVTELKDLAERIEELENGLGVERG